MLRDKPWDGSESFWILPEECPLTMILHKTFKGFIDPLKLIGRSQFKNSYTGEGLTRHTNSIKKSICKL